MKGKFSLSSALALSFALNIPVVAHAADAAPAADQAAPPKTDTGVADIVVTARRVQEKLQDVPISITVFNQQQVSSSNIVAATDLADFTPSLTSNMNGGTQNTSFAIRGFVQDPPTSPAVGVYFADVVAPRGSTNGQSAGDGAGAGSFFDLQNVQVLKGAQGTLFGRNTTGGAILLVPQKPTDRLEGYLEGSYGNYNMERVQGVLNIPLSDHARLRLGVDRQKRDGYMKNDSGYGPDRLSNVDYIALRASLALDLAPNLENVTIGSFSRSDTAGDVQKLIAAGSGSFGSLAQAQLNAEAAKGAGFYTEQSILDDPRTLLQQWQVINTTTWRASTNLTVKNIVSYAQLFEDLRSILFGADWNVGPGAPLGLATSVNAPGHHNIDQSTFTEELQFQGTANRLTWQAGGYMELSDPLAPGVGRAPTLLACTNYQALICTNPIGYGAVSNDTNASTFRDYGLYAQDTYALTDQLKLTTGVRYTWDRETSTADLATLLLTSPGVTTFGLCTNPDSVAPTCANTYHSRSSKPTWLIDLDYKPTENTLLYAKWTRGYRAGGISNLAPTQAAVFAPEKVEEYEAGLKSQFGGPLRGMFNVAGFYNNLTNQQIRYNLFPKPDEQGVSQASAIGNAGKSRIYGVEVEAGITPVTGLRLDASYAFTHAELESFVLPTLPADSPYTTGTQSLFKGDTLPLTPKNKLSLSATYTLPLAASVGAVSVGGTYVHTDKQLTNYAYRNSAGQLDGLSFVGSRDLLNLNVDWKAMFGSKFDTAFFMTNVTGQHYYEYIPGLDTSNLGFETAVVGAPRMFGFRVRYHFGT